MGSHIREEMKGGRYRAGVGRKQPVYTNRTWLLGAGEEGEARRANDRACIY